MEKPFFDLKVISVPFLEMVVPLLGVGSGCGGGGDPKGGAHTGDPPLALALLWCMGLAPPKSWGEKDLKPRTQSPLCVKV